MKGPRPLTAVVLASAVLAAAVGATAALPALGAETSPEPGSAAPVGEAPIEGVTWLLLAQTVGGEMTAIPDGVSVSLVLEAGQASGMVAATATSPRTS